MGVGNELYFKLYSFFHWTHEASTVCQPCAGHWHISEFSSLIPHISPRTHKKHRKASVWSCDSNTYDRDTERHGNHRRSWPGLGVVRDCDSYSYQWEAEQPPPQTSAGGGKINFASHHHLIHTWVCPHSYSPAPEGCLFSGAPSTVIKQRGLEKGRQSAREFHSL